MDIYHLLLDEGVITEEQVEKCREVEEAQTLPADRAIVEAGVLTEKRMLSIVGRIFGLSYYEKLDSFRVPEAFLSRIPIGFARSCNLIAIGQENGTVLVATCTACDNHPLDDVAQRLGCEAEPVLAQLAEIQSMINKAYEKDRDLGEVLENLDVDADLSAMSADIEVAADLLDVAQQAPIIKLVNTILHQALRQRASDIHIQPLEDMLKVRYRIDGNLYDRMDLQKKLQEAVISRVKVMGKMDIAERRLPQDGRASIRVGDREIDLRISSVPTAFGERIVFRILDKGSRIYSLEEIGLLDRNFDYVDTFIHYDHGIIFVTGPTGSGKTTTLYSALAKINAPDKNIMTIEDPIEYHLRGISQIQVHAKKGLTFAAGLRSLLRQDPDIMMVGEVRDEETARIAIQASLTGHLVLSTIHTNDAPSAVTRVLDIGIEPYLVSSSVICVIAQRLVRKICDHCKMAYEATFEEVTDLGIDPETLPDGMLHKGKGCEQCMDTGYWGRSGIFEVLPMSERVRQFVMARSGASEIKKHVVDNDIMTTLRMDGASKVIAGTTTVEEILSSTQMDIY